MKLARKSPVSVSLSQQHVKESCEVAHLDVDEGGEVELVSGPLTQKELVTLLLRQSVEELRGKGGGG